MASSSGPGHSAFGLGRKKKSPGLMDQISKIFTGDKKKRSKGSFRGHTASPQQSSTRRKQNENAVLKFFRSLVATSPRPKSRVSFESDHLFSSFLQKKQRKLSTNCNKFCPNVAIFFL
uniref:Myelin basic protein n=1 Tax=Periophthalmus magnuspinnatus TaxID=409849 RepID=A0A3B4AH58_9GOBI